ncbi:MAG: D-alanyl-D-alanine carboxypeptidase [Undibacterium sp.]|nr:D-alanyl-D-alanine carboxypeptidase [Opitutaceae bacterium]
MIFPRLVLITLALAAPLAAATRAKPTRPDASELGSYKGAIVMDAATGNILFENNPDVVTPPASMTKLMTFAVLHDKLAEGSLTLSTVVTADAADAGIGGTQVFLKEKEQFTVEEMLYAMMIQSANDCAHALARHAAGSVSAFVDLMNAKARSLGMTHTTFRSPHGLPPTSRRIEDGDLTSPRDFALLCRYLLQKTDVLTYTSVRERDFGDNRPGGPQHMENHNKLLGKVNGVDGLKTGYTVGAGYCLSATALRNGRRLIVVIMGSFGPKGAIDKGRTRDLKTIELIERGFTALPPGGPAFSSPTPVGAAPGTSTLTPAPLTTAEKKASAPADPVIKFSLPPQKKK